MIYVVCGGGGGGDVYDDVYVPLEDYVDPLEDPVDPLEDESHDVVATTLMKQHVHETKHPYQQNGAWLVVWLGDDFSCLTLDVDLNCVAPPVQIN